ncbi:MAG: hypothetical protein KDK76_02840 [Chlamydiia bacterium]|nr:hypothetical protein [Chlamydiia bacterium]
MERIGISPPYFSDYPLMGKMMLGSVALSFISVKALKGAQDFTGWDVAPFEGKMMFALAFGMLFASYVAGGQVIRGRLPQTDGELTGFLNRHFGNIYTVRNNEMVIISKDYPTLPPILNQLNDQRCDHITLNHTPTQEKSGDRLYHHIQSKGGSDHKALLILNQIEIQSFAIPYGELGGFFDELNLDLALTGVREDSQEIDLSDTEEGFLVTSKVTMQISRPNKKVFGKLEISLNIQIPLDDQEGPIGEWSWKIIEVS